MFELVLASQSPRRAEILSKAGFHFRVLTPQLSEILNENMSLEDAVEDLARQKASCLLEQHKELKSGNNLILAADTIVVLSGKVFGKPRDIYEAKQILCELSEKTHSVISGYCLINVQLNKIVTDHDIARVEFFPLAEEQIEKYLRGSDWQDKAGAYGIQSEGRDFVKGLDGSFNTVMGFPIHKFESLLKQLGWQVGRR